MHAKYGIALSRMEITMAVLGDLGRYPTEMMPKPRLSIRSMLLVTAACALCLPFFVQMLHTKPSSQNFDWIKLDVGTTVCESDRPIEFDVSSTKLGSTGFEAHAGPAIYMDENNTDPDVYSISVDYSTEFGSVIGFAREFLPSQLPAGFIDRDVTEIVTFDESTRTVSFAIGESSFRYNLPVPY